MYVLSAELGIIMENAFPAYVTADKSKIFQQLT